MAALSTARANGMWSSTWAFLARAWCARHRGGKVGRISVTEMRTSSRSTAFKITRMGQLVAQEASRRLGVPFGIIDLSLAPTPAVGDSVRICWRGWALSSRRTRHHGCTGSAQRPVKKGGVMASSHVGGLSGAFIPVSEDADMIAAAKSGALSITKLEAMTAVCSVGLDMICVPGDTSAARSFRHDRRRGCHRHGQPEDDRRAPDSGHGKKVGDELNFGGLLGCGPVMEVNTNALRPCSSTAAAVSLPRCRALKTDEVRGAPR